MIIPASGCVLLSADYCQLELRILAHYSQDSCLREVLSGGEDPFLHIASKVLCSSGCEAAQQRNVAKQVSSLIYYRFSFREFQFKNK